MECASFIFSLILLTHSATTIVAADDSSTTYPSPSLSPVFKPSTLVVVAIVILTTVFSLTFLIHLYARHCKQLAAIATADSAAARKNSRVDWSVVESLPMFRYASLRSSRIKGRRTWCMECAVCLGRFEGLEVLRLLPKCNHVFHVECVDTWLDAHSTCPLCRYRVDPEDVLKRGEMKRW